MADRYERVYDVGLLDDLHNYFPGLLYEPDRFRTVSDVLGYVRQNASRRFNLFDYGARQYEQNRTQRANTVPQNTFTRQTPIVPRWTPPTVPIVQPSQYEFDLTNEVDLAILSPLLRSLDRLSGLAPPPAIPHQPILRAHGQNRFAGLFQDVIIHASQELIDNGSNMRTLLMDLEESCSICQDRMRQGENIRRLNACQHEFHGACVDNWFLQRSVLCPVCRHDIRDPTPVIRSPTVGPVANTQAIPPLVPNRNILNPEDDTDGDESPIPAEPEPQNTSRLRSRTDINSIFNRRLE
jgi:hypothetical protein